MITIDKAKIMVKKRERGFLCTFWIVVAITGYFLLNRVIAQSTRADIGVANIICGIGTFIVFHKEILISGRFRIKKPSWLLAGLGALGFICITLGLLGAQANIGYLRTIQFVYDAFVVAVY